LPGVALALVKPKEIGLVHQNLAAHLQHGRHVFAMQAERYRPHRADIRGHILARGPVAARCGLSEHAVLVTKADGQTVEFEFGGIFHLLRVETVAHAAIEVFDVFVRETVI